MSDAATQIILLIAPSILTILSMIGIIVKVIVSFKALKKEVVDMKDIKDLKTQMQMVLQENYELKKRLNETMTMIDHVDRRDRGNGRGKK